jgi:hypothetical protein
MTRSNRIHSPALRAIALALSLLLLATLLAGCSSGSKPIKPSEQDLKVVATCGDYDIYYEELRYVTMSYKEQMASIYGKDIWTDPEKVAVYLPKLQKKISESLTVNYAILTLCAEVAISIEEEAIQESVQEMIDQTVAEVGGRQNYIDLLEQMYMTDHFVRFTLATDMCETELAYVMMDLEQIIDNEKDFLPYALDDKNFCATFHLYIINDPGDDVEANRALAEEALQMLKDGKPIKEMIASKYNEDVYETGTPYHFTRGEYEEIYEETAFALEVGERSGIIEAEGGFYIIERQPLSEAYITKNLTELLQRYQYAQVELLISERRKELTVDWTEYGQSLDLLNMK